MNPNVKTKAAESMKAALPNAKLIQSRPEHLKFQVEALNRKEILEVLQASFHCETLEIRRSGTGLLVIIK